MANLWDELDDDTAESRAAKGLKQIAQATLDSGPMPKAGSEEFASGKAEPSADLMDIIPVEKAALTGAAGAAKVASLIKGAALAKAGASNPALGALALGAIKSVAKKEAKELPMDLASRMARAEKMGFDTSKTFYHGTRADIDAFDPNALGSATGAESAKNAYFFAQDAATASDYSRLAPDRALLRNSAEIKKLEKEMREFDAEMAEKYGKSNLNFGNGPPTSWRDKASQNELAHYNGLSDAIDKIKNESSAIPGGSVDNSFRKFEKSQPEYQEINKRWLAEKEKVDHALRELNLAKENFGVNSKEAKNADAAFTAAFMKRAEIDDEYKTLVETFRDRFTAKGRNVIPVHLKMENPYVHDFKGKSYRDSSYADLIEEAKRLGHDSVIFKNTYDPADERNRVMQDIVAVFDPSQIRSKFAKFDPKMKKSGNIAAGLGGAALLGGAAASSQDAQAAEPEVALQSAMQHEAFNDELQKVLQDRPDLIPVAKKIGLIGD